MLWVPWFCRDNNDDFIVSLFQLELQVGFRRFEWNVGFCRGFRLHGANLHFLINLPQMASTLIIQGKIETPETT